MSCNPQVRVKVASPNINDDDCAAVSRALRSGQLASGPLCHQFEERFAAYVGSDNAVAVNSGTAALHAALDAAGVEPGDEVIVPAMTFFSTATAVIHQGGVPVFADVSPDNFCLDPADLARALSPRTKAIVPVHYFGHAAEMDAIMAFANDHGLVVIEDCAQAHGTRYKGRVVGSIGDMGAFSFFATKHMTTGEGGAVTTNRADFVARMRCFRSHGMEGRDDHVILGYNYRMSEPAAALGISQLERLDEFNAQRVDVTRRVIEQIQEIPWLSVPRVPPHVHHTFFWCHVVIDEARLGLTTREFVHALAQQGVEVRNRYWEPLYRQPLLTRAVPPILRMVAGANLPDYGGLSLPNAESLAGRVIGLPNRPDMEEREIERLVEVLLSFGT